MEGLHAPETLPISLGPTRATVRQLLTPPALQPDKRTMATVLKEKERLCIPQLLLDFQRTGDRLQVADGGSRAGAVPRAHRAFLWVAGGAAR